MASLWASPDDRQRLAEAEAALFLIGGYDGSGNYGDVLQLATAFETANRLSGAPLAVAVVEREMLAHHSELARRYAQRFGGAVFAFFEDGGDRPEDGLEELPPGIGPAESLLYIYGGGHLNGWWGARKAAHAAAAERLAGGRPLPVAASGLQVDEVAVEPGGPAHELLARASWIGVRDGESLELVRRHMPRGAGHLDLAGDDAVPFLRPQHVAAGSVVNLHLNDGVWVSEEPEATQRRIVTLLCELGKAAGEPLELQPVIAYEDPRVSERRLISTLLERYGDRLEDAGLVPVEPVDVLEDALGNGLARFARARLTVSCSYHVTLTSLLAGVPAVLLAENDYYEQKAAGLRDLFQLDAGLVGVRGTAADASVAVEALMDGPARNALLAHLQEHSRQVVERFDRGRAALSAEIVEALRLRHDEIQAMRTPLRSRVSRLLRRPSPPPAPPAIPAELREQISAIGTLAQDAVARGDHALAVARDMSLPTKMLAFMSWLELHPPTGGPLVSVVLATRDRPELLTRALASVVAQRYEEWELIVVDDGTDPGTRAVAEAVEDERLHLVEGPQRGLGAARNAGLDRAKGEVVCYLDDDNVMHPAWLHAVAHVFSERDDVDVAYGITLSEHRLPDDLGEYGWWPSLWHLPWSRETLERENVADAGALAHRRELDEARFNEELSTGEDWDLLLRLTADREALAVPALSHAYSMHGADRMSIDPEHRAGLEEIRRRHRGH